LSNLPQVGWDPAELGGQVLESALALVGRGVRVFPIWGVRAHRLELGGELVTELRCACGSPTCENAGKHPVGRLVPHGHNDAELAVDTVRQWFTPPGIKPHGWAPFNLGVATGRGLVVIDAEAKPSRVDLPAGLEVLDDWESWTGGSSLPTPTRRIQTGSGGVHLWLRVDPNLRVKSRNRVLPGVDVKADGGYVLAPPSAHVAGGQYSTLVDVAEADATGNLLSWLLTVKGGRYTSRKAGDSAASIPDDYNFHQIIHGGGCPAGHRDYFINDLCFRLRRAGSTRADAAAALRHEWLRMEHPPGDVFPWESCAYKLRRVWDEVQPEDVSDIPAWRPPRSERSAGEANTAPAVWSPAGAESGMVTSSEEATPVIIPGGEVDGAARGGAGGATAAELLERPDLTFHTTDTGNGSRFAQRMREAVRFCVGEGRWYLWDGARWAPDELNRALNLTRVVIEDLYVEAGRLEGDRREHVENWAKTSQALARRRAMLDSAAAEPGIAIKPDHLDSDPWLLVLRNGTLDLRTGLLRDSLPDDLNTRLADVAFDAGATCPLWEKHVEFVTRGDANLAAWLRRAVGYTLTGQTGEQKLFFLWGTGDNGKSTFLDIVKTLMGTYATTGDENLLTGTGGHPTQLADLRGARLVVCDETDRDKKLAEQRIKMMTGREIKARFMRQDFFRYTPQFKLWISGNHKPEIRGNDEGIWRRLQLVPFTAALTADTKILDYEDVLASELPGILNWAVTGLRDWRTLGQLGGVEAVALATREYRAEEDTIGSWLADCVELGAVDSYCESARLYGSYRWWCLENGFKDVQSSTKLGRELGSRGLKRDTERVAGRTTKIWRGVRLTAGSAAGEPVTD